ncbi:MAG: hypothetical protein IPH62_00770 [Ignavibacteriae bacterium]|nr:hypothetical protein [Ignavibacteriota bacterium]
MKINQSLKQLEEILSPIKPENQNIKISSVKIEDAMLGKIKISVDYIVSPLETEFENKDYK